MSRQAALDELIFALFNHDEMITDVRFATGEPVRIRKGPSQWQRLTDVDLGECVFADNNITNGQIELLIRKAYNLGEDRASGEAAMASILADLRKQALHPSIQIDGAVNGEALSMRVRLAITRSGMGQKIVVTVRGIPQAPESTASIGLPVVMRAFIRAKSGMIILCGQTGVGKSTTIAACLAEINAEKPGHIITIEDPVEFLHEPSRSFFTHREVGVDVASFAEGVEDALRAVPDVIMIGEIRNGETMAAALRAGESGHLVFASLHSPNATAALSKMRSFLPVAADQVALANNLICVVAQALVPDRRGQKTLVCEILDCQEAVVREAMTDDARMNDLDRKLRGKEINRSMAFVTALQRLVEADDVDPKVAASVVHHKEDAALLLGLEKGRASGQSATRR